MMNTYLSRGVVACWLALLTVAAASPLYAQPGTDNREKVRFETADQVQIHGTFYPAAVGRKAPCALLLHPPGEGHHHGEWDDLAAELQGDGVSVLAFDFRGHGDSRQVGEVFWQAADNRQLIRGFKPASPPESISVDDFTPGYFPRLINDIAAARAFLGRKNDGRECNAAELIVVGAGEGATLGAMWLASECARFAVVKGVPPRLAPRPMISDVLCAIWIDPVSELASRRVPTLDWLKTVGREHKVPTAILYGAEDKIAARWADRCVAAAKPKDEEGTLTAAQGIAGAKSDTGMDLLRSKYDTRRLIRNYVANVKEKHTGAVWEERAFNEQAFMWSWPGGGSVVAKVPEESALRLVPLAPLGIR